MVHEERLAPEAVKPARGDFGRRSKLPVQASVNGQRAALPLTQVLDIRERGKCVNPLGQGELEWDAELLRKERSML
ncbi:MAG: hypothetical protein DDT39_01264 [Firmicutes bacterium]|nr:hypothetical protein [candidate division NPL-UPA2 bacterium]